MTLNEVKSEFHNALELLYPPEEISSFFYLLTEQHLSVDRLENATDPNRSYLKAELLPLYKDLARLKKEEPIQYIIGTTNFMGLNLKVNPSVLIPRPETEELVDWVLKSHSLIINKSLKIADIGTGSGCIALALANKLLNSSVFALDISSAALEVAKENASENDIKIETIEWDALSGNNAWLNDEKLDIIVANPPYVRELEKKEISKNVLNYEPHSALFVSDQDPLIFYKAIATFAVDNLYESGTLFFEFNEYLGKEMRTMMEDLDFEIEIKKDLFGKERMLKAKLKK